MHVKLYKQQKRITDPDYAEKERLKGREYTEKSRSTDPELFYSRKRRDQRAFKQRVVEEGRINVILATRLRYRIKGVMKKQHIPKTKTTRESIGVESFEELQRYLHSTSVSQPVDLKQVHIDHIIPLSLFDLSNDREYIAANHYLNLQYMDARENLRKRNTFCGLPSHEWNGRRWADVFPDVAKKMIDKYVK